MGLWGALFGYKVVPTAPSVRAAAERNGLRFSETTAAALAKLMEGPMSAEVRALVKKLAQGGPYYRMAREKLYASGDPEVIAGLVQDIEYNRIESDEAVRYLAHPANHAATHQLATLTLSATRYYAVWRAVETLTAMRTPEADEALRTFAQAPPRQLYYDVAPDEPGETPGIIYRSSNDIPVPRRILK